MFSPLTIHRITLSVDATIKELYNTFLNTSELDEDDTTGQTGQELQAQDMNLTLEGEGSDALIAVLLGIYTPYTFPYQIRILCFLFWFFLFYKFFTLMNLSHVMSRISTLFYLA